MFHRQVDDFYEALEIGSEKTTLGIMPIKTPPEGAKETTPPPTPFITVPILRNCARCHGDHEELIFFELSTPICLRQGVALYTHWTLCPTNGEPILNMVTGRASTLPYHP